MIYNNLHIYFDELNTKVFAFYVVPQTYGRTIVICAVKMTIEYDVISKRRMIK